MSEWTLYSRHPRRLVRLRIARSRGWLREVGLGVSYVRTSYGTTYREAGTNEGNALRVCVGPFHVELLHTWKDYSNEKECAGE